MVGTSFSTRVPTPKELDSLPHVTLTANTPWDQSQAFFHLHEMEEEEEVDQEVVRVSVLAMYERARRVAASVFSESDKLNKCSCETG